MSAAVAVAVQSLRSAIRRRLPPCRQLSYIIPIDKDYFLAKVAKAYMAIIGDGRGGVFCDNSLDIPSRWQSGTQAEVKLGSFDVVLTNPPFGKKLRIDDRTTLQNYDLGHKWTKARDNNSYARVDELRDAQSPQILFIERCLDLVKDGGRICMIAPESMFSNPSHRYIVQHVKSRGRILAVVSFPEELFQPFTHAKACGVLIEKTPTDHDDPHNMFMAIAKWCGHDSRGLPVPNDDIPAIEKRFAKRRVGGLSEYDHLGFTISESDIIDDIYLPKYYNPETDAHLAGLKATHDLLALGELVEDGVIEITTGHEVGKLAYGTGSIPFVRTSDIANWEIKLDPKHGISRDIYETYREKQDVQPGDILMVRDGTYLVGTCAIISDADTEIVFQSHIYKIRSVDHELMHPHLLLALLSCPIVQQQIYAKRFTQDIIDTLGKRIRELQLPVPKSDSLKAETIAAVSSALSLKEDARALMRLARLEVADIGNIDEGEFMTLIG